MSVIHVCDLCGGQMPIDGQGKHYKIKEYRTGFWENRWITIEAHDECVRDLMDKAYARKLAEEGNNEAQKLD